MSLNQYRLSLFGTANWLMLGLVVTLALSFYLGDAWFGKNIDDTFNDPRRFKGLKTFEQAIVVLPEKSVYRPPTLAALQGKFACANAAMLMRLNNRLQVIEAKLSSLGLPDRQLHINVDQWDFDASMCLAVLEATKWLAQNDGRHLENMDWSGFQRSQSDRPPMHVPKTTFHQANPWRGATGCVYIGPFSERRLGYWLERRSNRESCLAMAPHDIDQQSIVAVEHGSESWAKDDPAWALPDNLATILADLNRIRTPTGITYGLYTQLGEQSEVRGKQQAHGPNRLRLRGQELDVGFNVFLTLDPGTQALAQQWAKCYSGDRHACEILGVDMNKLSAGFYEDAAMRMAAVVVLDVASGKIEALGSAHTDCYRQDHNSIRHDPECPDTPFRPRYDPDSLLNHALFTDAMPASTIKPILALGLLTDNPDYRVGAARDSLWRDLKTSNSRAFLDRLFCGREVTPELIWQSTACKRLQGVQQAARQVGWNLQCLEQGSADCARLDVLFGRPVGNWVVKGLAKQPLGLAMLYGRLFTESADAQSSDVDSGQFDWLLDDAPVSRQGFRLISNFDFDRDFAVTCREQKWGGCKGSAAKISNEGWGQGNARATPLGVAGMLSRLAAAANGYKRQAYPHLIEHVGDAEGKALPLMAERMAAPESIAVDSGLAALVLQGMRSHQSGGTAYSACKRVLAKECAGIDWIAGKTGTPSFGFDQSPLSSIAKKCSYTVKKPLAVCNMLPYKWYVAAFKTRNEANAPFDKVIAVLSERNWDKNKGLVQAPGDKGINLSAELAFRVISAMRQQLEKPVSAAFSGSQEAL
ncbi:MAG: hypothetical protein ISR72_04315 [Methylobacter sp.]|nr:hypothetical protein [Methylobacter sp.]